MNVTFPHQRMYSHCVCSSLHREFSGEFLSVVLLSKYFCIFSLRDHLWTPGALDIIILCGFFYVPYINVH